MVISNQRRSIHFSSAVLIVGLLSATAAFAPPPPPPPLANQPFALVRFADNDAGKLLLAEHGRDFEGSIALKVINNVPLNIIVKVSPLDNSGPPLTWSAKLNEPGETQSFQRNSTSNKINALHRPGAEGDLELCVKLQGMDMRWHAAHRAGTNVQMAQIAITVIMNP